MTWITKPEKGVWNSTNCLGTLPIVQSASTDTICKVPDAFFRHAAVIVLAVGLAGAGSGLTAIQAQAAQVQKQPQGPSHNGVLKSIDAGQKTLTVTVMIKPELKQTEEMTFAIAEGAKIYLEDRLGKDQPIIEGKLADLTEGTHVTVQLDVDKKTAHTITARGPGLLGVVKSVNASLNTITVSTKGQSGHTEHTITLATGAKVLLNDGLTKETRDQEGKLADLAEGTRVLLQLTVNRASALSIRVEGAGVQGTLKSYDAGTSALTVTVKENGSVMDKAFTLLKGARLVDLIEGQPVQLQLSVFDITKVVSAQGHKGNEQ